MAMLLMWSQEDVATQTHPNTHSSKNTARLLLAMLFLLYVYVHDVYMCTVCMYHITLATYISPLSRACVCTQGKANMDYMFFFLLKGLVQQLSMLRSINTKLTDESDLREYGSVSADITDGSASLAREMEDAEGQLRSPGRFSSELVEEDDSDIIVDDDSNFVLPDIDAIDITV